MSTKEDIDTWLRQRPKWLQEAAKRLLDNNCLEEQDLINLLEICRKEAIGVAEDYEYSLLTDIFRESTADSLHICSIENVQNINALAPKKPLQFGEGNLVVVYGQNGSGKSGYVRILKHMCGARHLERLRSNIYASQQSSQQCSITYRKDDSLTKCSWKADSGVIENLRCIDIYDASCGQGYISSENEVTYEPLELLFFSDLTAICEKMARLIDIEIENHTTNIPSLPTDYENTVVGKWYTSLSKDASPDDIEKHCVWKKADDDKLEELEKRLSEHAPADKAKQIRTRKQHADDLLQDVEELIVKLSNENCQRIFEEKKQYLLKQKAVKTAAEQVFKEAPLEGVGSDVWRLLWEQARKYSQEQAYRERAFPFTGDDSRCVLCQQTLLNESKKRLESFEIFVKGEMLEDAEAAKMEFDQTIESIGDILSLETVKTKADAAGIDEEDILFIKELYITFLNRKEQLLRVDSCDEMNTLPKRQKWMDRVMSLSSSYDESAKKYEEDAKTTDNRIELDSNRLELKARKWLSEQRKSVESEIERLKNIYELQLARRLTDTTGLSRKKGELAELLVTDAFVRRFDNELNRLGAGRIKIEMVKTRVEKGHVLYCLHLRDTSGCPPQDVLSEGENRIVSIAAFLADVAEKQNSAPFVFDDPISSLDQDFEENVVQRLVELTKARQVIIFTHRLSLLSLVQEYGKKSGSEPYIICVRREDWGTGEPGDTPIYGKKPENALNMLLNDTLPKARKKLTEEGQESYTPYAKSICSDFRILLERMIENDLLADVVQRYRRAVNTMGKIEKLAKITEADCKLFDDMMTKYSRYEHSQPSEAPVALPGPNELQEDIESLKKWREEFKNRLV